MIFKRRSPGDDSHIQRSGYWCHCQMIPEDKDNNRNTPVTEPHLKNMSAGIKYGSAEYYYWKLENFNLDVSHEESIDWGNPIKAVTQHRLGCSQGHSFTHTSTMAETLWQMENQFRVCSFHSVFPVCVGRNKNWEALHWCIFNPN